MMYLFNVVSELSNYDRYQLVFSAYRYMCHFDW